MSRSVRLVVVGVLAVAMVVTIVAAVRLATRAGDTVVARVGGYELTDDRLEEILEAVDDNLLHQQARERMGAPASTRTSDGGWDPGFVAEVVTSEINFELATIALGDLGGEISAPDRQGARRTLDAFMGDTSALVSGGERAEALLSEYGAYSERLDDGLSAQRAVQRVVLARADRDAEVARLFAAMDPPVAVLCVTWVGVEVEGVREDDALPEGTDEDPFAGMRVDPDAGAALVALHDEVAAGADLVDGAEALELGPVSSDCGIEDDLDPEVAALAAELPEGEVSRISPLHDGFGIVQLDQRRPAEVEEAPAVVAFLVEEVLPGDLLDTVLRRTADEVEVWVDPAIGRWDVEDLRVVPPAQVGEGFELLPDDPADVADEPGMGGPGQAPPGELAPDAGVPAPLAPDMVDPLVPTVPADEGPHTDGGSEGDP